MLFEYKNDETGEIIARDFEFGKSPPSKIEYEGKEYHRHFSSMTVIYGPNFNTEGQIKFTRPPLEGDGLEFT